MKALFVVGRPGHSTVIMDSWPWTKVMFRFENEAIGDVRQKDEELLGYAETMAPDVIIYIAVCLSPEQFDGHAPYRGVPYDKTFCKLRGIAPTAFVCCDGGDLGWQRLLRRYYEHECFDTMVTIDGVIDWPLKDKKGCWVGLNPWPRLEDIEVKPLADRSIPFGFQGAVGLGTRRWQLVEELKNTVGLHGQARGCVSTPGSAIPYADYRRRLTDFRIGLNMAWSGLESCLHVKGRVLEYGWAGCCLLENKGSWTKEWFTPGEDYAEYEDAADAARQVRALLADLPRAQTMADNLRRKVAEQHSAEAFWTKVVHHLGLVA